MLGTPPFTLAVTAFPLRALAALAGRAPMGGQRETALGVLMAARLVAAALPPAPLTPALRASRAQAARQWLSSVTIPAPVRTALGKLIDATALDDPMGMGVALAKVTEVTAPHLDRASRSELTRLTERLAK